MDEIYNTDKRAQIVSDAINSAIKADLLNIISKKIEDLHVILLKCDKGCFLSKVFYRHLFFRKSRKLIAYADKCKDVMKNIL